MWKDDGYFEAWHAVLAATLSLFAEAKRCGQMVICRLTEEACVYRLIGSVTSRMMATNPKNMKRPMTATATGASRRMSASRPVSFS